MTTPTPGRHAPAAVATPPVSTPFSANHPSHPAFSPHGPRSVVPSPQQVKKSPANSNTMYGYPGGGGHPTNSSFGAGYDSPSAAMALGVVPGLEGMGLDGMGVGTPMGGSGGTGLGLGLGLGVGGEEAKRRKLEEVMEILKANKGRLSEAGIERLVKRFGLDCFWEDQMGSGKSIRKLIIGGSALSLDIDFEKNMVKKVALAFPDSPESVTRHTGAAGEILFRDLEFGPGESPLTKKLDRFAANLERLAMLDKLSVIPGLNCHEAIAGIYESIERLHLWEVQRLRDSEEMKGKKEEDVVKAAMHTRSGKPIMHSRNRLGMSLDYWRDNRFLVGGGKEKHYTLLIECAPLPSLVYQPLRVSDNWISAQIEKPSDPADDLFMASGNGPVLDWLQPENALLPATDQPKVDGMEGVEHTQKFPEVMFVAKLDPPLVVPSNIAMQIYNSTGVGPEHFPTISYDELLLPRQPEEVPDLDKRTLRRMTTVAIFKEGEKSVCDHQNMLLIEKSDYGRLLSEVPFSHPQQLVEWLPALRQAAFLNSVLLKTFGPASRPFTPPKEDKKRSQKSEFEDFMSRPLVSKTTRVDVQLVTQPVPRLTIVFPFGKTVIKPGDNWKQGVAQVVFEIKPNGGVEIFSQNVLDESLEVGVGGEAMDEGMGKGRKLMVADLARMLELTEDLGVWVEFVRRRLG